MNENEKEILVNFFVRNLDNKIYENIKAIAKLNKRSANSQILITLENNYNEKTSTRKD